MWWKFAFLFLFLYTGVFSVSTSYHHVNEVFNAISHDYLYHAILIDLASEEIYFDKPLVRQLVNEHFKKNLKPKDYEYIITFFKEGEECSESIQSKVFTINLVVSLSYLAIYNKTYTYYFT